jgi:hypothetical protein
MSRNQIERLKKDQRELTHQIRRLQKKGLDGKSTPLDGEREFLKSNN